VGNEHERNWLDKGSGLIWLENPISFDPPDRGISEDLRTFGLHFDNLSVSDDNQDNHLSAYLLF